MENDKDMEHSIIARVGSISGIGKRIKCMVKVYYIIQTIKLHMKVNGRMINCQVMELFITNK
jgi:hypothetical protein